jgi:putative inorganic carbon (hco3(-)) transporter
VTSNLSTRTAVTSPFLAPIAAGALALLSVPFALLAATRPGLVLVALAVLAVVALSAARVEFPILLLVATAPLEAIFTTDQDSQLSVTKVVGALAFASFALNAIVARRRLYFDAGHALVFGLLAIAMISTLQAEHIPEAITTTTRYASFVALFFVVSQFVGDHGFQVRIAWVLSISSAIAGALASWNFLSGQTLSARLPNGDPNDVAFILATTLPFSFWLLRESGWRRAAAVAMVGVIAVTTLLTLSRGALVGLGAGLLWLAIVERRQLKAIVGGAVIAAVVLAVVVHVEQDRVETGLRAKEKVASSNVASRLEAWRAAADLAAERPLLGVGPGNYQFHYLEATDRPAGTPALRVVHNAYLDIAAELGPLAMVLFLGYLIAMVARLTTAVRHRLGPPGIASAARTALIVGIFASITLSEQYFAPFWLLGGLATAIWHERTLGAPASATPAAG